MLKSKIAEVIALGDFYDCQERCPYKPKQPNCEKCVLLVADKILALIIEEIPKERSYGLEDDLKTEGWNRYRSVLLERLQK